MQNVVITPRAPLRQSVESAWIITGNFIGTHIFSAAGNDVWKVALFITPHERVRFMQQMPRLVVLIVEDDLLIRMNTAEMILDAGFDVVEAGSADEAIVILEGRLDIRVVFTDIEMPGSMDGLRLAAAIRGRWPPIKIIAASGRVAVTSLQLPEGSRFLPKPYSNRDVIMALRDMTNAA
jgi:CheY-like chemotaxis protein